jgi:hypothetical protein
VGVNIPVRIGNVTVLPGDLVVGERLREKTGRTKGHRNQSPERFIRCNKSVTGNAEPAKQRCGIVRLD